VLFPGVLRLVQFCGPDYAVALFVIALLLLLLLLLLPMLKRCS
jgi:hypothetical protein